MEAVHTHVSLVAHMNGSCHDIRVSHVICTINVTDTLTPYMVTAHIPATQLSRICVQGRVAESHASYTSQSCRYISDTLHAVNGSSTHTSNTSRPRTPSHTTHPTRHPCRPQIDRRKLTRTTPESRWEGEGGGGHTRYLVTQVQRLKVPLLK